ncbi:MAG TPA: aspartate aminotransferase family protein [Clostridiaceae bacterium]|nr:aspartate aminotransferase family protein [Clostridiaceae bacterium]
MNNNQTTANIITQDQTYYLNTFGARTPVVLTEGKGCRVTDLDGKSYLDLVAGIAVNVLGHSNAHLVETIAKQAAQLIHCSNLYYNVPQTELAARLTAWTDMEKVFFCNSGAEANEAAIKLVRGYFHEQGSERYRFYSALNSFHGRTLATITATGQPKYNKPFAPLPEGFDYLPFNDLDAVKEVVAKSDTAGIILELIQGESGIHPVSQSYASAVEKLCREHGVMLVVDEIQTGMGRTGQFTASQTYGIRPDVISMAKGLAGGLVIGAVLAQGDVTNGFTPGSHGTTFGGNPLACAGAMAVLDEYERLNLIQAAAQQGEYFLSVLTDVKNEFPERITEVRGKGLMLAIDFKEKEAFAIRDALLKAGVLINATGPNTLRLLPPLIIKQTEIDEFCEILTDILK